jgi:DNA-binding NtrC family response regulator
MQLEAELDLPLASQSGALNTGLAHAREMLQQTSGFNLDDMLMQQTSQFIDAAMELTHGNISEAAKLLGLNRTTLYSRMEALQKHKSNKVREGFQ